MVKRTKIMIILLILSILLGLSTVSAGFLGFGDPEVNGVPFKILDGFHTNELTGGMDSLGFMTDEYTSDLYPNPVHVYVGIHSTDNLDESKEYYMGQSDENHSTLFVNKSSKQISGFNTELFVVKDSWENNELEYIYFFTKEGKDFYMSVNVILKDSELAEILNA